MPAAAAVTIVNVGFRSTNCWVVSAGTSRVLVDLGWPGMYGTLRANLSRAGVPMHEILEADPRADIRNVASINRTFKGGVSYDLVDPARPIR